MDIPILLIIFVFVTIVFTFFLTLFLIRAAVMRRLDADGPPQIPAEQNPTSIPSSTIPVSPTVESQSPPSAATPLPPNKPLT